MLPLLVAMSPNAIFLLVTNPVDVLTYAAVRLSGLPARRESGRDWPRAVGAVVDAGSVPFGRGDPEDLVV